MIIHHLLLFSFTEQGQYSEFNTWLSGCVEKAAESLKVDGDPSEITKQLKEQRVSFTCMYICIIEIHLLHTRYISFQQHIYMISCCITGSLGRSEGSCLITHFSDSIGERAGGLCTGEWGNWHCRHWLF